MSLFFLMIRRPPRSTRTDTLFPNTTLFRSEFERALIRERTRAGIKAAVARGARPGNPKMRSRDPGAIAEIRASHKERHLNELLDGRHRWHPTVARLRPQLPCGLELRQIQALPPPVRRSDERSVGKEWFSTCRSRGAPSH